MKKVLFSFLAVAVLFGYAANASNKQESNPICIIKTSMGDIHVKLFSDETPKTVENFIGLAEGTKEFTDPRTKEKVKRPYYDGLTFHRVVKDFMIQGGCPLGDGTGGPGFTFEDEINATALGLDTIKAMDPGNIPHEWLLIRNREAFSRMIVLPLARSMGITNQQAFESRIEEVRKRVSELTLKDAYENLGYQYNDTRNSHHPKRGVLAMANAGPSTNGSQFFINLVDTPWLTGRHTVFGEVIQGMDVVDSIGQVKVDSETNKPIEDVKIISIRKTGTSVKRSLEKGTSSKLNHRGR